MSIPSSTVTFLQGGTGAVQRTVQDKLAERISVADFAGSDPTGTTDSTAAFQAALNYLASLPYGGELFIPCGLYILSSKLTFSGPAITVRGAGRNTTWLQWTAASSSQGLSFSLGSPPNTFPPSAPITEPTFRDFTLNTLANNSGDAIAIYYGAPGTVFRPVTIEYVAILSPGGPATANWTNGLHIQNGQEVFVRNCLIIAGNVNFTNCLFLDYDVSVSAYDIRIDACTFQGATNATLYANGRMESLFISNCSFEFAHQGVYCNASSVSPFSDVLSLTNSQITCQYIGINMNNWTTIYIHGTDVYSGTGGGLDTNGSNISLTNCNKAHITGCKIEVGYTTGISRVGITGTNTNNVAISGCQIYANAAGISIAGATSTNWVIQGNVITGAGGIGTNGIITGVGMPGTYVISGNTISSFSTGVAMQSPNARVGGNLILNCTTGIYSATSGIDARSNEMVNNTNDFQGGMRRDFVITQSLTPSVVSNNASTAVGLTLTGAEPGDSVQVAAPSGLSNLLASAWVNGANGGVMNFYNLTGSPVTPPSGIYTFYVSN